MHCFSQSGTFIGVYMSGRVSSHDSAHPCDHAVTVAVTQPPQPKPCCRSLVEIVWMCLLLALCGHGHVWLCTLCAAACVPDCPYVCACTQMPMFACALVCASVCTAARCPVCMCLWVTVCTCMCGDCRYVPHWYGIMCAGRDETGQMGGHRGQRGHMGWLQRVRLWLIWYFSV